MHTYFLTNAQNLKLHLRNSYTMWVLPCMCQKYGSEVMESEQIYNKLYRIKAHF